MKNGAHVTVAVLALAAALVLIRVGALPSGASTLACVDMVPRHLKALADGIIAPQESVSPYGVATAVKGYEPGGSVSVSITANPGNMTFQGFLLQARRAGAGSSPEPVGTFLPARDGASRLIACQAVGDSVTHAGAGEKPAGMSFIWQAPEDSVGDVKFLLTVVKNHDVHWVRMESDVLTSSSAPPVAALSVSLVFFFVMVTRVF